MNAPGTSALAKPAELEDVSTPVLAEPIPANVERPRVAGKFLFAGDEKLWIKGVTYGTFAPREDGSEFPARDVVQRDFAMMAARGINSVRTYIPPPRWLLDRAQQAGLRVMVGLAWEQHVAFLDNKPLIKTIEGRIRDGVAACKGHPAVLCYTIGNEIPPSIVRWHGRKKIERFLKKLYGIAKETDPGGLVTYVNFPTTEYLQLPFLDFQCFNVYLEDRETLANYLARLQNLVDEKPLVMAEIGLDSQRNGEDIQAESLDWQMRTAFAEGCAGTFIFAWTDEWYRGGADIEDWDFGLTTRDREPKPALEAVTKAYAELPFPPQENWPKVSVVVCSYNGASTIRDTMEGLKTLEYPNFEVIVVNDGSTDATLKIAAEYDVKLINQENLGLSAARNTGWQNAEGEIIAYIDDDAYPDPHWLHYIVHTYQTTDFVGVGGPNIAPPGDGPIAECVYNAPGGPVQVLLTDREAEHIPGCNMTFKRSALETVGGFDPRYRAAGDDVDVCWRIQEQVGKIGFHAAAMDWHHRRNSLKMYWNQQKGYGKAEALLEEKWPQKYNTMGHFSWSGRLYGRGLTESLKFSSPKVYGGPWGSALFQSLYQPAQGLLTALPLMPEWYFVIGMLAVLSLLGLSWTPLLWFTPLLAIAVAAPIVQAVISAARAEFPTPPADRKDSFKLRAITAALHLVQPLARLIGRLKHGLYPWRRGGSGKPNFKVTTTEQTLWFEEWNDPSAVVNRLNNELNQQITPTFAGGDLDDWDLAIRGGIFGSSYVNMAVEEHGGGKQLFRFRIQPHPSKWFLWVAGLSFVIVVLSGLNGSGLVTVIASMFFLWLVAMILRDIDAAIAIAAKAIKSLEAT
jgi:GT2 family glycosyltransferase